MPIEIDRLEALIVDEDQAIPDVATPVPPADVLESDEVAFNGGTGLSTFDPNLAAAALAITGVAPDPECFPTPQLAFEDDFFTLDPNTVNLALLSTAGTTTTPGEPFPTTIGEGIDSLLTTADGDTIYLFGVEGNDNLVYGAIANDPAAPAAFVIVLDRDDLPVEIVTSASLWIILYTAVTHDGQNVTEGDLVDLTNLVYVASSKTETQVFSDFSDVPSGAPIFAMIGS